MTDRCPSCLARIAMNSGDHADATRQKAGRDCTCDPLRHAGNAGRIENQDIAPPTPKFTDRCDPAWETDLDAFGSWGSSVRMWEDRT